MAKRWKWFDRGKNSGQNSSEKDKIKTSRVLLGKLKHYKPCYRSLFELGLPQNPSKWSIFFPPLDPLLSPERVRFEGQTFPQWKIQRDFQKLSFRQRRRLKQKKIYILPIGPFPSFVGERIYGLEFSLFELLCKFVSLFYLGFDVELSDVVNLDEICCKTRIHGGTGKTQILVGDVLSYLRQSLPNDAFLIIGITWEDMYPSDEWNFVLGEASSVDGCAAMSFGHYEPKQSQRIYAVNKKSTDHVKHSRTDDQHDREGRKDFSLHSRQFSSDVGKNSLGDETLGTADANVAISNDEHSRTSDQFCKKQNDDFGGESSISESQEKGNQNENWESEKLGESVNEKTSADSISSNDKGVRETSEMDSRDRIDKIDAFQIWKFFRVISHELGHVFGLTHCVYFSCAMNESSTVQEAVSQPLFMCPVCLKKIQTAVGFDIAERYNKLQEFLEMVYSGLIGTLDQGNNDELKSTKETLVSENKELYQLQRFSEAIDWLKSVLRYLNEV